MQKGLHVCSASHAKKDCAHSVSRIRATSSSRATARRPMRRPTSRTSSNAAQRLCQTWARRRELQRWRVSPMLHRSPTSRASVGAATLQSTRTRLPPTRSPRRTPPPLRVAPTVAALRHAISAIQRIALPTRTTHRALAIEHRRTHASTRQQPNAPTQRAPPPRRRTPRACLARLRLRQQRA